MKNRREKINVTESDQVYCGTSPGHLAVAHSRRGKEENARKSTYIRRKLELRPLSRRIDKFASKLKDFGFGGLSWEAMLYPNDLGEDAAEFVEGGQADAFLVGRLQAITQALRRFDLAPEVKTALDSLLREQQFDEQDKQKLQSLVEKVCDLAQDQPWTIDSSYLIYIQNLGKMVNWNKEKEIERMTGKVTEVERIPSPAMLEAFADMMDRVESAIASPDVKEERGE